MDLNAPREPEDKHNEHGKSAVQISRPERTQRMPRQLMPDDRPLSVVHHHPTQCGNEYRVKRQRPFYGKLPPGWLDCPAFGQEILGCLIPSKVPLGESFDDSIPPCKRYSIRQVLDPQRGLGSKIGLVIDLTNSNRYYEVEGWRKAGIKHLKIASKGHESVPEDEDVKKFVDEVSRFLTWRKEPKKYVLVHCTHGHNRTGYMIVHYLVRTQNVSVSQAIKMFTDARPPGIYKPDYIDALHDFYHEKKQGIVCPPTPEWKRSSHLDRNADAMPDGQLVMTNDDVLGAKIPAGQESAMLQRFCYQCLKISDKLWQHKRFPGSNPVSLDCVNLQLLRQRFYGVTWKADGTRYMMLITMDRCYLIDRHFNFWRVQMRFPCRPANEGTQRMPHHHLTLLDGEMIIDTLPNSQKQVRRYLIYDMMVTNQVSIVDLPFYKRWEMIEKELIEPRNFERQHINQSQNPDHYRYDLEPFSVRRKTFSPLLNVTKLLKEFIPNLPHAADGLIFQCWDDPYVPLTHEGLLKWKYPEMNSVDFLFDCQSLYLNQQGKKKLMEGHRVVFPDGSDPLAYSGKIIECSYRSKEDVWVYMRIRPDKGTPNEFTTYSKVMKSIKDNITEDVLLNKINEIICLPMYEADRIQNERKSQ